MYGVSPRRFSAASCVVVQVVLCLFPTRTGKAPGTWDRLSARPTRVLQVLLVSHRASMQLPSHGLVAPRYCSDLAPGALGTELLGAAPQNHAAHPTQCAHKHTGLYFMQTTEANTRFIIRERQRGALGGLILLTRCF